MGGGALLLLGLGGAALMRRRRYDEPVEAHIEPMAAPATAFEPAPAMAATAAMAPRPALESTTYGNATLEAMVAAAPSADNPFLTRTKRLRRAQHLIAQRDAMVATPAPQTTRAEPAPVAQVDRSQTVYRFGNQGAPSGFLKPRTR